MQGDVSYLFDAIPSSEIDEALRMDYEDAKSTAVPVPVRDVKRLYFRSEKAFVRYISSVTVKLPAFKVVVPSSAGVGSIYYVVEVIDPYDGEVIAFFRGTYGYYGEGCHQSAFVEKALRRLGIPLEVRDGDYLLSLLRIV